MMRTSILLAVAVTTAGGCKKKPVEPMAPIVGWHTEEGAMGACWHPPAFDELGLGDRRMARTETMNALLAQWRGERDDGVAFDVRLVDNVETQLLGYPEKVEAVAMKNLALCQAAMAGGGTSAWSAYVETLPRALIAGECRKPLDDTMFWYVDLGQGWQGGASICDDDLVKVMASSQDYYKVDENGPWINATGDTSKPTFGLEGYLCTTEDCYAGQLVMRFRGTDGSEFVKPIGLGIEFSPPTHGTIEFAVNDTTYFNNEWKVERGIKHRTSVTYEPVED